MNYELAKELKGAGFPQEASTKGNMTNLPPQGYSLNGVYIPTLEELIEACGEIILEANKTNSGGLYSTAEAVRGNTRHHQVGSTPKEAVARLWLAL